jgi:glycosyltransferase involved in cell wall biosynthesis
MTSPLPANVVARAVACPRLLYVVSEDWYFLSHRLPMARAARAAGFEVHVATNVQTGAAAIAREQFILHPVPFARGSYSPNAALRTAMALRRVHARVKPSLVHHISPQPIVLGLLSVIDRQVRAVNSMTGLGYTFISKRRSAAVVRPFVATLLRALINRDGLINVVQNDDDRGRLVSIGVAPHRIAIIRGSGVDVKRLRPLPEPEGPPTVGFVGRLLDDKCIRTLIVAHRLLRIRDPKLRLLIAGMPDPANPASLTGEEAAAWSKQAGITWLGHVDDVTQVWRQAHIAVLPSRREGLPLSLLEAAACGRAMVASDVAGCREIVVAQESGLLVPVDNAPALADAIWRLWTEPELRRKYGLRARELAVEYFSADAIGEQMAALYREAIKVDSIAALVR